MRDVRRAPSKAVADRRESAGIAANGGE
ncbi:hypothetical protein M218_01925 [Burkholderia pseudomallei MSHR338]|nr:hypothetical protein M218_01925 [Burkholderia pseudomallei MSHR338]